MSVRTFAVEPNRSPQKLPRNTQSTIIFVAQVEPKFADISFIKHTQKHFKLQKSFRSDLFFLSSSRKSHDRSSCGFSTFDSYIEPSDSVCGTFLTERIVSLFNVDTKKEQP